jgi:hypothetical protein
LHEKKFLSSHNYLIFCEFNVSKNQDPTAMKKQIIQSINDPEALEMLFRKDKSGFTLDFSEASAGIPVYFRDEINAIASFKPTWTRV